MSSRPGWHRWRRTKKGSIELNDDLRHYAFSNIFEVCSKSKPYERVMVASNLEYAAEAVRAEGRLALVHPRRMMNSPS